MTDWQNYELYSGVKEVFRTPTSFSHCVGYYYNKPMSADGKFLLSHRVAFDDRPVKPDDIAEIGFFEISSGCWHSLGFTNAFNWQQGSMLQWLGPDYQNRIIYNDIINQSFVSIVVDITDGNKHIIKAPIYAVDYSGKKAIGVNYERLYFVRSYHYEGVRNNKWNRPVHPEDGLFFVDLEKGSNKLIIKTTELVEKGVLTNYNANQHWLDHVVWNPSGERFAFLYRFGVNEKFVTCLYTANFDGSEIYQFPEMDQLSHMAWRNNTQLVVWSKPKSSISKSYTRFATQNNVITSIIPKVYRLLKKRVLSDNLQHIIKRGGAAFMLMEDKTSTYKPLGFTKLKFDGHPSWTTDGRYILTDTYADEFNYRHLLIYDTKEGLLHPIGKFYSKFNSLSYRCDLHPRFGTNDNTIIIDSYHGERRQVIILEIDWRGLVSQ